VSWPAGISSIAPFSAWASRSDQGPAAGDQCRSLNINDGEALMAGYVIVNVTVRDPVRYEEYRRLATPTVSAYGGRYLVRGGAVEAREGGWTPSRLVVLEFPDVERARAWWDSPEYAPAKAIRQSCADTQLVITEGVPA
jgi:uncharacterized protein (DUF1330 family)